MSSVDELKQNVAKALNDVAFPDKSKIKKPHNRLWIALIAFLVIFGLLDFITGVSVGYSTRWYYGVLVFASGFGTMVIHELLYTNPYAKGWQKGLAVFGFFTSISVTGLIGISAIVFTLVPQQYDREILGLLMVGFSFLALFLHGALIVSYYFIDSGILAKQRATGSIAKQEGILMQFALAEQMTDKINDLEEKLNKRIEKGDAVRIGKSLTNITGEDFDLSSKDTKRPS